MRCQRLLCRMAVVGLVITFFGISAIAQGVAHFRVNPANEHVWGHNWPSGNTVTVMVGDPAQTIGTAIVDAAGNWHLDGDDHDYDIQVGDLVSVTDGVTPISHTVLALTVTEIDPDTDIVTGTATPYTWVGIGFDGVGRYVQASASGEWLADFSVAVTNAGDWGRAYDLVEDLQGTVGQEDSSSQPFGSTFIEWRIVEEELSVDVGWIVIQDSAEYGGQTNYLFEIELEGRGVLSSRLRSPSGVWYDLEPEWWREEQCFETNVASITELNSLFPEGDYTLVITYTGGTSTGVVNVAESLVWPNAMPTLLYPQDGAVGIPVPDATLQWSAAVNPNFDWIVVEVEAQNSDFEIGDMFNTNSLSEYLMTGLEGNGDYEVSLGFANIQNVSLVGGGTCTLYRAQFVESEFSTVAVAPAWDDGHQDIGGGWRRLSWFGDYAPMGVDGWIWHGKHGFFFVPSNNTPENVWLFSQNMGWLYTGNSTYPFLFRSSDSAWLWYNGSTNPRWFVNMGTGQWESHD